MRLGHSSPQLLYTFCRINNLLVKHLAIDSTGVNKGSLFTIKILVKAVILLLSIVEDPLVDESEAY